jgi:nucleotide-binding universal stress UspA family protein
MLDSILVPLDGSLLAECVLSHVVAVAQAFDSKVTLLRVLDRHADGELGQSMDLLNWQIAKTDAKFYLEKITARLSESGIQAHEEVLEGLAAETVTEYARSHRMQLIILSSHGNTGLSKWGISSVTQKIIYGAPSSVMLIRARRPMTGELILRDRPYQRIMAPLDGSWRAENVLPTTTLLSRFHRSKIHLVHVVKTPEMARHMPLANEDLDLSNRIVARNREEAVRYLDQMRLHSPMVDLDLKTHLLTSDNAAAALHELVDTEQIDLMILSAHGYSGHQQWPYGSMVNNFILYGQVPLLIVQDLPIKEESAQAATAIREHPEH